MILSKFVNKIKNFKWLKTSAVVLGILPLFMSTAYAQNKDDDTPAMQYWIGGKASVKLQLGLNSSGAGSGSGMFGGIISPAVGSRAASVFSNPAELAQLRSASFMFDTKLPIRPEYFGVKGSSIVSESSIADGTDSFLEDTATFKYNKNTSYRKDTEMSSLDLEQRSQISSIALAVPLGRKFVLGFGIYNPIDIDMSFALNNIATDLKTVKQVGNNTTDIDFKLQASMVGMLNLSLTQTSYALGYEAINNEKYELSFGFSLDYFKMKNKFDLNLYTDGMMILNNNLEYYFNQPSDIRMDASKNETNKLYWRARGNYQDSKLGYKIGTSFKINEIGSFLKSLNVSFLINYVPEFKLTDPNAYTESYQPKFLVGRFSGEGADELDIVIDSIDLAKPNLTVPTSNYFSKEVKIALPSSFTLGFDANFGGTTLALNVIKYYNEFSYEFAKYKIGKKPDFGIKAGFDFRLPDEMKGWNWALLPIRLLYLDFDGLILQAFGSKTGYTNSHYRIAGGVMTGDAIVEGIDKEDQRKNFTDALGTALPVSFALSRQYTILEKLNIGVLVFGFPDMFMRVSVGYSL